MNELEMDAAVSTLGTSAEVREEEPNAPLNSLLHTLQLQARAALEEDTRVKNEVESARRVLVRMAEAASGALERLSYAEEQLEYKWAKLAALLNEVKALEEERREALMLAQQLSGLDPELMAQVRVEEHVEEEIPSHDVELEPLSAPVVVPLEASRPLSSPVADLRAAVKYVVQAGSASRLSR